MKQKTVRGITRSRLFARCFEASMDRGAGPGFADSWLKWFDAQPDDNAPASVTEVKRPFEAGDLDAVTVSETCIVASGDPKECANFDNSGCANCEYHASIACPDDCPQPEFYIADLEEVAAMQTSRIEAALIQLVGLNSPMADGNGSNRAAPGWLVTLFAELHQELKTPGYVVGLIPE